MAYGLYNTKTYRGVRLVEWRSEGSCWDHVTSASIANWLYPISADEVDFDMSHIIEFIIEKPSSLGLGYGPGREILNELKKEENYNRLSKYYQEQVDWQLAAWNYVPKYDKGRTH